MRYYRLTTYLKGYNVNPSFKFILGNRDVKI